MAEEHSTGSPQKPSPEPERTPIPAGYHQGIINAITVLLAFSLLFARYWNFELPGPWNFSSSIAAVLMGLAIVLQTVALWRSLQVKDDYQSEYNKTLRWFLVSVVVMFVSVVISTLSYSKVLKF
jgi:uncharacterized membrane protein YidH (DUF202 family)